MTDQIEKTEPVRGTRPGFRPADRLGEGLKAPHGFTARWVRNDAANVAKKKAEGWIVMKPSDNKGEYVEDFDVNQGTPMHNGIRYQDMIAMMLPNELKESRDEYYRNEVKNTTRNVLRQTDDEMRRAGVQTYAPKGQKGRVVID